MAAKVLNILGFWGMGSTSVESWELLGRRKFLLRDKTPQSVYTEHSEGLTLWCTLIIWATLHLWELFLHCDNFLHYLTLSQRGSQKTCHATLPALGGQACDLASSYQTILGEKIWREQVRRQVHLGILIFQQARWVEGPSSWGAGSGSASEVQSLASQVLSASVSSISARKGEVGYCSRMFIFLVISSGSTR